MFRALSFRALHRACLDFGVTPALEKKDALVLLGLFNLPLRTSRRFRAERFHLVPLPFLDLALGFLRNVAKVLVSLFIFVAKNLIKSPSVSPVTIVCFSIAIKRHFIGILIDLQ